MFSPPCSVQGFIQFFLTGDEVVEDDPCFLLLKNLL